MDPMGLGRQHGAQRQSPDYVWTILESLGMKEWSQMEVVDPCIPQGMKPLIKSPRGLAGTKTYRGSPPMILCDGFLNL